MTGIAGLSPSSGDYGEETLPPKSVEKAIKHLGRVENRGFTNDISDKNTLVLAGLLRIAFQNLSSCAELSIRGLHAEPFLLAALHVVDGVALGRGSYTSEIEQDLNSSFKEAALILKRGIKTFLSDPIQSSRKARILMEDLDEGAKVVIAESLAMRSLPEDLRKGRFPNDLKDHMSLFDDLKQLSATIDAEQSGKPGDFRILSHSVGAAYELMVYAIAHGERGRGVRGRRFLLAAEEHLSTFADSTIVVPAQIGFEPVQKLNDVVKALEDSHTATKEKYYEDAKDLLLSAKESCEEFNQLLSEGAKAA